MQEKKIIWKRILLGIFIVLVFLFVIIVINRIYHQYRIEENRIPIYYNSSEFLQLSSYENVSVSKGNFDKDMQLLKENGIENNTLLINSYEQYEAYINMLNQVGVSSIYKVNKEDDYWENGSMIVYYYSNQTHVTDMKVTNITSAEKSCMIDLAVCEAEPITNSVFGDVRKNMSMLYIYTDKIPDGTNIDFHIKTYDAVLKKWSPEEYNQWYA